MENALRRRYRKRLRCKAPTLWTGTPSRTHTTSHHMRCRRSEQPRAFRTHHIFSSWRSPCSR
nr:MAG TPA: hypothetical protein [Caudoviricetes sp.]